MGSSIQEYLHPGKRVHLCGIGGVSMSPLAEVLHSMGLQVQGSDMQDSPVVAHLRSLGIPITVGHQAQAVEGADFLIDKVHHAEAGLLFLVRTQ